MMWKQQSSKAVASAVVIVVLVVIGGRVLRAQTVTPDAQSCDLAAQQQKLTAMLNDLPADPKAQQAALLAKFYEVGMAYQQLALNCGYKPTDAELKTLADTAIQWVGRDALLAIDSIGTDVEEILDQLADVPGDPVSGQLLYNGLQPAADGSPLGCSGCHEAGSAPATEGTYTRVTEQRLTQPEFAGYTFEQYVVESIVQPNAHIAPGFNANLMPDNFGKRLTIQNLADIITYLSSQDQ
jgi:hypothetical protein